MSPTATSKGWPGRVNTRVTIKLVVLPSALLDWSAIMRESVAVEHFWRDGATPASAQFKMGFAKVGQLEFTEVFGVRGCGNCRA